MIQMPALTRQQIRARVRARKKAALAHVRRTTVATRSKAKREAAAGPVSLTRLNRHASKLERAERTAAHRAGRKSRRAERRAKASNPAAAKG